MIKNIATEIILNIHIVPWNIAQEQAEIILNRIELEGMKPPGYMKPIDNPLIPGDFKNEKGQWCTPEVQEWEPEDE